MSENYIKKDIDQYFESLNKDLKTSEEKIDLMSSLLKNKDLENKSLKLEIQAKTDVRID